MEVYCLGLSSWRLSMTTEEQIKAVNKQIAFLEKFKDKLTQGKQEKLIELNYTVECLREVVKILENISTLRESLVKITQQIIS